MDCKMLGTSWLLAAGALAGCVAYQPVPLRDGAFPLGTVRAGDDVRAATHAGNELAFEVASVEGGTALMAASGRRVAAADLASLEVARRDKHKTHVALAVVGGVLAAAFFVETSEAAAVCIESNADVCGDRLLR